MNLNEIVADLYLAGITEEDGNNHELTVTEISSELSLPIDKVRKIIFGEDETGTSATCPYRKKILLGNRVPVKSYVKYKGQIFLKAQATAMSVLQRGLDELLSQKESLNVSQLRELSNIAGNIDRMYRLESGMPTDIIRSMDMGPEKIIEIIKNDPMYGGIKDGKEILSRDSGGEGSENQEIGGRENKIDGRTRDSKEEINCPKTDNLELFPSNRE